MTKLFVHVEGQTEETFVNELLAPHLYSLGKFSSVSARLIGSARLRSRRGGIKPWVEVQQGIVRHLNEHRENVVTTMVDYFGMPRMGSRAWPGRSSADRQESHSAKATVVETILAREISSVMGPNFMEHRFIPYVMLHEFEAMLFSDCRKFAEITGHPNLEPHLQSIRSQFATPEEIDDSPEKSPSHRIKALIPGYRKPFMGYLGILSIGIEKVRSECPHFASWLARLESFP